MTRIEDEDHDEQPEAQATTRPGEDDAGVDDAGGPTDPQNPTG